MKVLHTIAEFRAHRRELGDRGIRAFVPTMGALHEGHASLLRQARAMVVNGGGEGGAALASIFVNPTQFGPGEDYARYPRTLDADLNMLRSAGCDAVFVPTAQEMYPEIGESGGGNGMRTTIDPGPVGDVLEGAIRPGHFRGVCTVVAKLLNVVEPTHLLLGQKDYQQQAILRQMCADLNMPVEVVTCATIREADGLAMSSRNRYLSANERARACGIYEALAGAKRAYEAGERRAGILEEAMDRHLKERGLEPQYAVIAHARSLARFAEHAAGGLIDGPAVALIAARSRVVAPGETAGGGGSGAGAGTPPQVTRLIDNMIL